MMNKYGNKRSASLNEVFQLSIYLSIALMKNRIYGSKDVLVIYICDASPDVISIKLKTFSQKSFSHQYFALFR